MNQLEMEKQFDKIYDETIPLVLFSTVSDRKEYGDFLSSLFISYRNDNTIAFNESYELLVNKLKNKSTYDRHQREYIEAFHNRYLSFNQRMENIENTYLVFQDMVEQIKNDHQALQQHGRSLNKLHKKINFKQVLLQPKRIDNKVEVKDSNKDVKPKISVCPICNTKLYPQKRKGGLVFYCKENNKYKHWFRMNSNNKFYYCEKCNSVMTGSGKTLRCSNCDNRRKVIK